MSEFSYGHEQKPVPFERFRTTLTFPDEVAERIRSIVDKELDIVQKMEAFVKAGRELVAADSTWERTADFTGIESELPEDNVYDITIEGYPYETGDFSPGHPDLRDGRVRPVAINVKTGKALFMGYGQMYDEHHPREDPESGFLLIADPELKEQEAEVYITRAEEGWELDMSEAEKALIEVLKQEK